MTSPIATNVSFESLKYFLIGKLNRDFILTNEGLSLSDVLGGNLLYAACGLRVWDDAKIGLSARIGEDFPNAWLEKIVSNGFDGSGLRILNELFEQRRFAVFTNSESKKNETPFSHYSRLGVPFPMGLLGYQQAEKSLDVRGEYRPASVRLLDLPEEYLNASAVHLCPLDYTSHSTLIPYLHQARINTITLDPSTSYMDPLFWNEIPFLLRDLTGLIVSEEKLANLFWGRTTDVWEMVDSLSDFGCNIIVVKRKNLGQLVFDRYSRTRWSIPAYAAQLVNPMGAGDAFCGGFLAGYRATYSPLDAALYGNISASIAIEGNTPFFILDALPRLIQARLDALRQLVQKI